VLKFKHPEPALMDIEGQKVIVHPLNAGQFSELLQSIEAYKKSGEAHKADFLLLSMTVKDESGNPAFATVDDAMTVPVTVAGVLLPVCLRVNGMGQADEKKD
jgi:hypothetical protein